MMPELLDRIERTDALDGAVEQVRQRVRPALSGGRTSYVLSGAWLGHPLHPLATDLVIGPWLSAYVLDLAGGAAARHAARRLVGLGILASAPTAAAGLHDWKDAHAPARRSGLVHAVANLLGLGLQVASWSARRQGRYGRGVVLSSGALAAVGLGGYLGGHLSYVLGTGVARTAFEEGPSEWVPAVERASLVAGPRTAEVAGTRVLLVDDGGMVRAVADTCNHAGCSLADGDITGQVITCSCHGSQFWLHDGSVRSGPAATPQPVFATRVVDGVVQVRRRW